jgi:hypothetical protein
VGVAMTFIIIDRDNINHCDKKKSSQIPSQHHHRVGPVSFPPRFNFPSKINTDESSQPMMTRRC